MADKEHLRILNQGVEVWNRWREENPGITPDLEGADLSDAGLSHVNLSGANLSEAELFNANLSGANLTRAELSAANLIKAELFNANLTAADLTRAELSGASLSEADLTDATGLTREQIERAVWEKEHPPILPDEIRESPE